MVNSLEADHYLLEIKLRRDTVDDFDQYPFSLPAIHDLDALELHPAVTFFVGENGSGKSTLLEAIATAWGFNPEGGTKNFSFTTRSSHSELHEHLRLVKGIKRAKDGFFLRAESYFNVGTEIERLDEDPGGGRIIDSYGGRSLHEQSHGESFMSLMMHRFGGNGLYILDEPEAALSPTRQLAMLSRMHQLIEDNAQFIIATHSPIIMAYPNAKLFELTTENGVQESEYTETEHYQITRDFLSNPMRTLDILLEPSVD